MSNWQYTQPVRIIFGNGMRKYLTDEIRSLGGVNGILITSASFAKRGLAKQIVKDSKGC